MKSRGERYDDQSDAHHKTEMEVLMDHPGVNDTTQPLSALEGANQSLSALKALNPSSGGNE